MYLINNYVKHLKNCIFNFFLLIATGGWPEQENPHTTRINALIDYHKILASIEKQQCERKKFPKRSFIPAVSLMCYKRELIMCLFKCTFLIITIYV